MAQVLITISRQIGSGGAFVGEQVARRLGIKYLDREILEEAAKVLQEDQSVLEGREERLSSFLEDFVRSLSIGGPDGVYMPPPYRIIYDRDLYNAEAEIIRRITRVESAVIVGRAGFHILRGYPGLINIFLHAPKSFRIRRVQEIYRFRESGQAETLVEKSDRCRRDFIERMTGETWNNAFKFQLCLDTEAAGFAIAEETILKIAGTKHS